MMDADIQVTGLIINVKVKENSFGLMEIIILANGKMIRDMDKE
jgi:hypothetical protein